MKKEEGKMKKMISHPPRAVLFLHSSFFIPPL